MPKSPKNFSLLLRKGKSRVSMRQLQHSNLTASENEEIASDASTSTGGDKMGDDHDWTLSRSAVFKILLSARLTASLWAVISDCDEVYNYWEPLHLVLFGRGFQTWEYSPAYAIRSWLYVLLYALPAQPLVALLPSSKVALFFAIRVFIGVGSLLSELLLYHSVCRRAGNSTGRAFLLFSLLSPAMFNASCAFLPSAFSMTVNAAATALYLREQWFASIFLTALSALVGWPFAALLGLPILLHMLAVNPRQMARKFLVYSAIAGSLILGALCAVDSHLFGKFVIAPLNIVLYNVFSSHGPNLYGVEPVIFYIRNLALNFNLALPMAILAIILLFFFICLSLVSDGNFKMAKDGQCKGGLSMTSNEFLNDWSLVKRSSGTLNWIPFALIAVSTCTWIGVFLVQPHKEERFLFPIYPCICLLAGIGFDLVRRIIRPLPFSTWITASIATLFIALSISRTLAVHRNYSGLVDTYRMFNEHLYGNNASLDLAQMQDPIRLCVGKEWHRFPSSFFLPESVIGQQGELRRVELEFLRSEFTGILPKHFPNGGGNDLLTDKTRQVPTQMNDANREEPSRYWPLGKCDFLIDLDGSEETEREPNFAKMQDLFRVIDQRKVLIAAQSHPIYRAFYIPFTESRLTFGNMYLLQKVV